jgi:hypothetical protein
MPHLTEKGESCWTGDEPVEPLQNILLRASHFELRNCSICLRIENKSVYMSKREQESKRGKKKGKYIPEVAWPRQLGTQKHTDKQLGTFAVAGASSSEKKGTKLIFIF